ncbi:CapA family protein [Butyrivibrio sp. WCD3002]|uniref:CapA family protein n=1 Tax=Butyrivibrio sp. WCD3002 TaxID=1280676 RepID=UPI0004133D8E|nr:CapA family protein [Butyrivibrio sp. WCD3002]
MSKYNEIMENIEVSEEMKNRILKNIEAQAKAADQGPIFKDSSESEPDVEDKNFDNKKKEKPGSAEIIKFVTSFATKAAVFALVAAGAYGVIRTVGLKNSSTMESATYEEAATATEEAYETEASAWTEEATYETDDAEMEEGAAYETEATKDSSEDKADNNDEASYAIEEAEEGTAAATSENGITLLMVGDILLHTPVEEAAKTTNGDYNFDFIFEHTKDEISAADIAMVNQEVIIGGEELGVSGYPAFNAPYAIGDALVNAGFDVICHATNHALDKGKKGILNTTNYWEENHPEITVVGINETEDEYENIDIIEKDGIRIAILNYTFGTNGISAPSDMPHIVDTLDENKVAADLKYAEDNADFTVVCPHWGTEYKLGIDKSQEKWTDVFRKNGADLVLGTHPHVIEPIELITENKDGITNNHGDGDMLVYYSLGNFVNWTSGTGDGTANRMLGGMANVTISRDENGDIAVSDYSVRAVVCHVESGPQNVTVYPLSDYTDALASENEIRTQDPSFSREYLVKLCNEIWGNIWK